jgi:fructan beta-fructosidase
VLTVGTGDQIPESKIGTQYVIGQFNGKTFTIDREDDGMYWVDFGADFFAAQAWNSVPDQRKIWTAWKNNWRYAEKTPTSTWRGALTIPTELGLVETETGLRLTQKPVSEFTLLRDARWRWGNVTIQPDHPFHPFVKGNQLKIVAEIEAVIHAASFGIRVLAGNENGMTIGYDPQKQTLFIDRTQSGQVDFHEEFPSVHQSPLTLDNGRLRLHIFVDRSMVEVFANDSLACFSERVFPDESSTGIVVFTEGAAVQLKSFEVFELKTAVFNPPSISLEAAKPKSQ